MVTSIKGNDTSTFGGQVVIPSPAFRATIASNQSLTNSTATKLQLASEQFDLTNDYDNATNYRFTPSVAGYYQVNCSVYYAGSNMTRGITRLYKNGSEYGRADFKFTTDTIIPYSDLVYMNGTTDYLELYGWCSFTTSALAAVSYTMFTAHLVRAV
jgi:hypothetical protein